MTDKRAVEILDRCEKDLQKLAAEVLGAGDYPAARRVMDLAQTVSQLAGEAKSSGAAPTALPQNGAILPQTGKGKRIAEQYPKFYRRGDELVKVGWSKKDRKVYVHRAPHVAVDLLATAVKQVGARGKLFTSDDILPIKNPADGFELPPYQVYLALAWLRELGLVEQHGRRGGYTLVANGQLDSSVSAAWAELADWRG